MKKNAILGLFCSLFILLVTGCGGGGGGSSITNGQTPASPAQKTAVITFSAISTSRLPVRINGVEIIAILPNGITVPTESTIPSQVSVFALAAGNAVSSAVSSNSYVFGSYSASSKKIKISVADSSSTQDGFGPGDFVQLTCDVTSGTILTENNFTVLNSPLLYMKVVGYDSTSRNTVNLTSYLKPSLKVTFGN